MEYILCYCSTLQFFLQAQSSVPCNGGHVCSINKGFTYHNTKYGHISDAVFYLYQWFPTVYHSQTGKTKVVLLGLPVLQCAIQIIVYKFNYQKYIYMCVFTI
jgi:hypothetical protein